MLQVAFIRQHTDLVKERLAVRNFADINLIDEIIALDDQRKKLQSDTDTNLAKINASSKEIGQLLSKGQKAEAETKKAEVAEIRNALAPMQAQLSTVEKQLHDTLVKIPNIPSATGTRRKNTG